MSADPVGPAGQPTRRHRRWPLVVLVVLLVCLALFSGLKIYQVSAVNSQADDFYASLRQQATHDSGAARTIDWPLLDAENPRIAAWIHQTGTPIDYPVVEADDYAYYLTHLPDATENPHGTPFVDFNDAPDFSGPLTVIYGNDVSGSAMFGSLDSYRDQGYFDQHPGLDLYTPDGDYRVALVYGADLAAGQWRQGRAFMYAANLASLLAYAQANTTFTSQAGSSPDSRWVALVTMSSSEGIDGGHYVLLGVLEPVEG